MTPRSVASGRLDSVLLMAQQQAYPAVQPLVRPVAAVLEHPEQGQGPGHRSRS